jgi:TonB family protein
MLRELFGSRPVRRIGSGPVATSAVAHAVVIAAVLMTTRGTDSNSHGVNRARQAAPLVIQLRYLTPTATDVATAGGRELHVPARPAKDARTSSPDGGHEEVPAHATAFKATLDAVTHSLADIHLADIHPALDIAEVMRGVEADTAAPAVVADSDFNSGAARLSDLAPIVPVAKNGIYTPDLVDEQVTPRPGNPKPRYPESLRAAGVEAEVNVQFVVDSTGQVNEPSIEFRSHVHQLFMDAIRASLRRARFFPARLAGNVVPQLVQQRFRFEIRERP